MLFKNTGCSAARLAHLVWDQRVAGSNPATPTKEKALHECAGLFCPNRTLSRPEYELNYSKSH